MFGNKKKEVTQKNSSLPMANSNSLNSLVKGTVVEGTVKSENDFRVDGTIKGSLSCGAKVIIGPSGFVDGEIHCQNAVIEGRFEGIMNVKELLNVRETAEVTGDINTNKLIVQSGAIFNVACKMGSHQSNGSAGNVKEAKSIVKEAQHAGAKK